MDKFNTIGAEYMENHLEVLNALKEKFPNELIKKREGPKKKVNGRWVAQYFDYIPTDHLHERLDSVVGLCWSWNILESHTVKFIKDVKVRKELEDGKYSFETVEKEVEQVIVKGRLTIDLPGLCVTRDSYGGCDISYGSQAGDSYKIADSNAFKKACYKLGIGRYLGIEGAEDVEPVVGKNPTNKTANPFAKPF